MWLLIYKFSKFQKIFQKTLENSRIPFSGDVLYVTISAVNPYLSFKASCQEALDVEKLSYENGLIKSRQAMFNHTNAVIHPIVFESSKDLCL
jgi:hypothetical protein